MATSLRKIAGFLEKGSFVFDVKEEDNSIITFSSMKNYIDQGGDYILPIVVLLQEEGRFIRISAPNCYVYRNAENKAELFQIIMVLSFQCKMMQFECDRIEETLSAVIEFPLEDSPLTEKQFFRCIDALAQNVDQFDSWIRLVLSSTRHLSNRHSSLPNLSSLLLQHLGSFQANLQVETTVEENPEQESDEEWI